MTKIKAILGHTKTPFASDGYSNDEMTIQYHDAAIQGKLVAARYRENNILSLSSQDYESEIKQKLAEFMAKKLIEDKLISFTKKTDPNTYLNEYIATVFVTPDQHVRLLRISMGQIKAKPEDLK